VGKERRRAPVDVNYENFVNDIQYGDHCSDDNGAIQMKVLGKNGHKVNCEVLTPANSAVGRHIKPARREGESPALTAKISPTGSLDSNLAWTLSPFRFVREAKDCASCADCFRKANGTRLVIAKIEDQEPLPIWMPSFSKPRCYGCQRRFGNRVPYEELPIIQRRIVKTCQQRGKPVIVATHMLESMIESPMPTRRVTDVAMPC